jgi:hypothetical protein
MIFRPLQPDDQNLIINSWLKTVKHDRSLPRDAVFAYRDIILMLLQRAQILCAVDDEDPSFIIAYIVYEKCNDLTTLHFAYTKQVFRKMGVMHELFSRINYVGTKGLITYKPKKIYLDFFNHTIGRYEPRLIYYPID